MIRVFLLAILLVPSSAFAAFSMNWDREAYVWRQSCITNSGAVSARAYVAATRGMRYLKMGGIRKSLLRSNFYMGGVSGGTDAQKTNAWVVPIIKGYPGATTGSAIDFMVAFTAAEFDESVGATGNGTTMHLRTGLAPTDQGTKDSLHLSVYCRSNKTEVGGCIGSSASGGFVNYFLFGWVDSNAYMYYDDAAAQVSNADTTPFTGFYMATRTSQSARAMYRRGVSLFTSSVDLGTTPALNNENIYIHGLDVAGSLNSPTTRTLCFYGIGSGITSDMQGNYFKAVQRIQYDMGRAIP